MDKKAADDRAHDLAASIYVELVARNTEISQDSVKLTASAANIASLSLKLSEAFLQAEEQAILAKVPAKAHSLEGDDIAKWSK
jgi:hypothetical protein